MARILEIARSLTRSQPNASALATAATLVRSIASRCRIHRVQRRVVFARGSAICGMRCWKILVAHSGLSQMKRGNRTCSFVGWPTIGRSVSLRSMWSRSRPGLSQSAQIGSMLTGEQNKCVNSPATAASSMVTPSSTVRQMLSASRLAVAFKAGPGDLRRWREEPSSSHAPGPLHLVPHGLRAGPLATHSETGRAPLSLPVSALTRLPRAGIVRWGTPCHRELMSQNTRISRAALGAAAACAVAVGVAMPATASAQGSLTPSSSALPRYRSPGPDTLVAPTGSPPGPCTGAVAAQIGTNGYPDSSSLHWGIAMPGVGACDLTVTLHWENLDTGDSGEKQYTVDEPELWTGVAHPKDSIVPTGAGEVEYRLTTDAGGAAGPITLETPEYQDCRSEERRVGKGSG